jgi:phenylacetate-CoA ligase
LITSAQVQDPEPIEAVRAELGLEPFNFYGCFEVGRIAWECPAHQGLHVNLDHLVVECLAEPGGPPEAGTVVVTALDRRAMPFLRYRLGDLARFVDGPCPCGVSFPRLAAPLGRTLDLIRLPSGRVLTPNAFIYLLRQVEGLRQYQVFQEDLGRFVARLVFDREPPIALFDGLRERLLAFLGEPVALEFQVVDSLPIDRAKPRTFVPLPH